MTRAFRFRNYGVYVLSERRAPHHSPHAHVKVRGRRVASVFLLTLTYFDVSEPLPAEVRTLICEEQANLLLLWTELNGDE